MYTIYFSSLEKQKRVYLKSFADPCSHLVRGGAVVIGFYQTKAIIANS